MAMSPTYALAHTFLPNWVKLKGAATIVSALERKDLIYFDPLWQQAYVTHNPYIFTAHREPLRIAIITLPQPKTMEMGEAFMAAIVVKTTDASFAKYYLLEHDFVLAKQSNRTLLTERDGRNHIKHGEGPALTGDPATDTAAFLDAIVKVASATPTGQLPR